MSASAKKVRDPIHGFIELEGRELDVLDTPLFQRLRRISQLALARLVYPGAVHTRFDHTLGVFRVAGSLCDALKIESPKAKLIRYGALLHDLGHGPFSHVSESVLASLAPPELTEAAGKKEKIHELITRQIIRQHPDLNAALSGKDREEITQLLNSGIEDRIHRDILSGPLDADKQDYLLRDSYFCGVQYGVFDLPQLHKSLCIGQDGNERVLMVTANGVHALEQFVLAKYYLTTQVYRHKVRLITDSMIVRALLLGVEHDKLPFLGALYRYRDGWDYVENYLAWDDQRLSVELLKPEHGKTQVGQLFRRLHERRLFKRVIEIRTRDLEPALATVLPSKFPQIRGELEAAVGEELARLQNARVDARHVILHLYKIDSVRAQSRNDESTVLVQKPQGPASFEDESALFRSINEGLQEEYLECYAPLENTDEKEKRRIKAELTKYFQDLLKQKLNRQLELPVASATP